MTPDSQLDRLVQDINTIKLELTRANRRIDEQDQYILKLLHTLKKSEETFEVRVARAQYNLLAGMTHTLEHSIEAYTENLKVRQRGFTVDVVNGKDVVENSETILVTKTESGYDYAKVTSDSVIQNDGTEPFSKYFDEYPEVFGDRTSILVNISTSVMESTDEQG